jgi:Uma2 family endonuclease
MVSTKLMTADELERLPDDDNRYELVQGELTPMTPVNLRHHRITGNVYGPLQVYVAQRNLGVVGGEGGFVLARDPDTVFAPDIAFVRADRWPHGDAEEHFGRFPPDLAVEVRSPSEPMRSLVAKARTYLDAGVRLVWLVDPESRTVLVFAPDADPITLTEFETQDWLDGGDVVPGFRLSVADVFR